MAKIVYVRDANGNLIQTTIEDLREERIAELEEENRKLKEERVDLISFNENYSPDVIVKYVDRYETLYNEVDIKCAKLSDENKRLKSDLDKYKKYYDRDKEELMESCYSLAKENEKLKSDLSECECSFGFESDEVGFWKREYKRLKKWIKDHCKGYGNLFPEDEMKREQKKADKKRKNIFMEEDTLQELKDIGELEDDELIYEEGLYE